MNADQLKGKWLQFKGDLKQQWGKFTEDDLQQIAGNYDTFVGKVKERYGEKKAELMKWASHWHEQAKPDAEGTKAPRIDTIGETDFAAHFHCSLKET